MYTHKRFYCYPVYLEIYFSPIEKNLITMSNIFSVVYLHRNQCFNFLFFIYQLKIFYSEFISYISFYSYFYILWISSVNIIIGIFEYILRRKTVLSSSIRRLHRILTTALSELSSLAARNKCVNNVAIISCSFSFLKREQNCGLIFNASLKLHRRGCLSATMEIVSIIVSFVGETILFFRVFGSRPPGPCQQANCEAICSILGGQKGS